MCNPYVLFCHQRFPHRRQRFSLILTWFMRTNIDMNNNDNNDNDSHNTPDKVVSNLNLCYVLGLGFCNCRCIESLDPRYSNTVLHE